MGVGTCARVYELCMCACACTYACVSVRACVCDVYVCVFMRLFSGRINVINTLENQNVSFAGHSSDGQSTRL